MRAQRRKHTARRLIALGAAGLLASLFMTWSHQFSPALLARFGSSALLGGVPHDPTAWQVYSVADVLLALLALGLAALAARAGGRSARIGATLAAVLALAFAFHALSKPPTNGATAVDASRSVPSYFPDSPGAGDGETVAIVALGFAVAGLGLSFTADRF